MDLGRSAVVSFKDEYIEGTIVAVAENDEQKRLYKIDSASFSKGPLWIASERVYQIQGEGAPARA